MKCPRCQCETDVPPHRRCREFGCDMTECPHWAYGCCSCGADYSAKEIDEALNKLEPE